VDEVSIITEATLVFLLQVLEGCGAHLLVQVVVSSILFKHQVVEWELGLAELFLYLEQVFFFVFD